MSEWSCSKCKTTDPTLRYPSGKMKKCKDCMRWQNVKVNSQKQRKRKPSPELNMTEAEFMAWSQARERRCDYCNIHERDLVHADILSSIGLPVVSLGIDRIDSSRGYQVDNITFCCFACNKAKGDVFTYEEMKVIGQSVAAAWTRRGIGGE